MSTPARTLFAFAALSISFSAYAQDQCATAPAADYSLTAQSGSPVPEPRTKSFSYTQKNDTDLLIRLEDINPYAFKCSVSTSTADFKETAVASFLGLIGGVANVQPAAAPAPAQPSGGVAAQAVGCQPGYLNGDTHKEVLDLERNRKAINDALSVTKQNQDTRLGEFNDRLHGLIELNASAACSTTVARAQDLLAMPIFEMAQATISQSGTSASLPLDQAIDQTAAQALALVGHLREGLTDACYQQFRQSIDQDTAFLSALVVGSTAAPSAVDKWRNQLKAFGTVRANILNAQSSIAAMLANRQNFTIDTSIHGNQQTVTYTATCTPNTIQTVVAPDPAASTLAASATTPVPPAKNAGTPAPAGNAWKHDFKFGPGPRFVYAGGLVISPLQQVTFSTTATPGGSGATANTIIQQQNSSTRILPIAMLHARYWDQLPPNKGYFLIPNYLSVGVTAKPSDNKGTNIEYLFGPSWSFADRQIFITAGAYAGQQQRLANSLTVGSTTSLSSSNLPITQTTIWKVGFAVTWAPAGK